MSSNRTIRRQEIVNKAEGSRISTYSDETKSGAGVRVVVKTVTGDLNQRWVRYPEYTDLDTGESRRVARHPRPGIAHLDVHER